MSIIQVYAPTSASPEENIEYFYSDLEDAYKKCGNQDIVIVMGDLNAKVGGEQDPLQEIVRKLGLGERNDRGDLLRTLKRKKEDVKLQLNLLTADNEYSREYSQKVSQTHGIY